MGIGIISTNKGDFSFQNDEGDVWLSYNDRNQTEVTFIADGSEWRPDSNAVISLNDMFLCIREFLNTYEKPTCIWWKILCFDSCRNGT